MTLTNQTQQGSQEAKVFNGELGDARNSFFGGAPDRLGRVQRHPTPTPDSPCPSCHKRNTPLLRPKAPDESATCSEADVDAEAASIRFFLLLVSLRRQKTRTTEFFSLRRRSIEPGFFRRNLLPSGFEPGLARPSSEVTLTSRQVKAHRCSFEIEIVDKDQRWKLNLEFFNFMLSPCPQILN